jgi:hypothetical protein
MPPLGLPLPPYDCGVPQGSLELKLYLLLSYGDNSSFYGHNRPLPFVGLLTHCWTFGFRILRNSYTVFVKTHMSKVNSVFS